MHINKDQVLIGMLLGDLHLQKTPSNANTCRLRLSHSPEQSKYVDWIYSVFIDWCKKTQPPKLVLTKKGYGEYQFYSGYRQEITPYHNLFYKKAPPGQIITKTQHERRFIKVLPANIESLLSPLALAVWYMDDGTKRTDCNAGRIATQCFTETEQIQLREAIWNRFSIKTVQDTWHDQDGKELLGLSIPSTGGHFEKWCNLVSPYIMKYVPDFSYKLIIN